MTLFYDQQEHSGWTNVKWSDQIVSQHFLQLIFSRPVGFFEVSQNKKFVLLVLKNFLKYYTKTLIKAYQNLFKNWKLLNYYAFFVLC